MEVVFDGLEVFKKSLPPALAGHWAEILLGLLTFLLLVFLCKYEMLGVYKKVVLHRFVQLLCFIA